MFKITTDKNSTVHITGELLIQDVEEFHQRVEELLNKGTPTTFDLSDLESIDVANLQVLLSYKRSIPGESEFSICKASENVKKTLKLIGFAKPLHYTG